MHHTVNSNGYSRDQVPSIIRGIYAYHTQSRGWSDVGYNFLVDRFGRIWEGRYGGVARPVVGAHTLGYNDYSFAMSAIGNFDVTGAPSAMLDAYGRLFAWKLSLHGVSASKHPPARGEQLLPGDQRPPRRRPDRVPGSLPVRQDPRHPDPRREDPEGRVDATSRQPGPGEEPGDEPVRCATGPTSPRDAPVSSPSTAPAGRSGSATATTAGREWGGKDLVAAAGRHDRRRDRRRRRA